jgi:hypothetical protein
MATTSKEGSRRATCPIFREGGSEGMCFLTIFSLIKNSLCKAYGEYWRASLVPAAAVIPAPLVYIKVAAVKKFVVEILEATSSVAFTSEKY